MNQHNQHDSRLNKTLDLPLTFDAQSANPVLDLMTKIDRHKATVQFLEAELRKHHHTKLCERMSKYSSAQEINNEATISASRMKQHIEECLVILKFRNVRSILFYFFVCNGSGLKG